MKQSIISTSFIYEINKSKFICHLIPFPDFDKTMDQLKQEHPKGRHFVYAYRYLNEFSQIVENQSDDGEPKGSSGPPTLAVLRGSELINTAVIIVRYFGGIKLGVGGLVRAYGKSVNLTIEKALDARNISQYINRKSIDYEIQIQNTGVVDHFLKSLNNILIQRSFENLSCIYTISATDEQHLEIKRYFNS